MSMDDTQNSTFAAAASSATSPPSKAAAMYSDSHARPGWQDIAESAQIRPWRARGARRRSEGWSAASAVASQSAGGGRRSSARDLGERGRL